MSLSSLAETLDAESSAPEYRSFFENVPEEFRNLTPTEFRIAEREPAPGRPHETLFIIPGFGVSVGQIDVDRLLWSQSDRYARIITHDAVNYRTTQASIVNQYHTLLRALLTESINILGISLGGGVAVQFLHAMQAHDPALFQKCKKLLTLISPVSETDLSQRWQTVLSFCRKLAALNREGSEAGFLRTKTLEALVGGITPLVRRSALEARTDEEVRNVFAYAGETFDGARSISLGSLHDIEIVSFGLQEDAMAGNTRACQYAEDGGRHVEVKGRHTPRFYAEAKELYDAMILQELG